MFNHLKLSLFLISRLHFRSHGTNSKLTLPPLHLESLTSVFGSIDIEKWRRFSRVVRHVDTQSSYDILNVACFHRFGNLCLPPFDRVHTAPERVKNGAKISQNAVAFTRYQCFSVTNSLRSKHDFTIHIGTIGTSV